MGYRSLVLFLYPWDGLTFSIQSPFDPSYPHPALQAIPDVPGLDRLKMLGAKEWRIKEYLVAVINEFSREKGVRGLTLRIPWDLRLEREALANDPIK